MIKICQIKYGEIIWWQRRWLEEEDFLKIEYVYVLLMEKKNIFIVWKKEVWLKAE